jgi:Zinc-binding dehydrogenase
VIGTVSTEIKAKIAREAGAEHVVLYGGRSLDDVVEDVKALTPDGFVGIRHLVELTTGSLTCTIHGGDNHNFRCHFSLGVHAVYDGIGKDTFESNFAVLRSKGTLVTYGNASGLVPPVSPLKLMEKNIKCGSSTAPPKIFVSFHRGHSPSSTLSDYPVLSQYRDRAMRTISRNRRISYRTVETSLTLWRRAIYDR